MWSAHVARQAGHPSSYPDPHHDVTHDYALSREILRQFGSPGRGGPVRAPRFSEAGRPLARVLCGPAAGAGPSGLAAFVPIARRRPRLAHCSCDGPRPIPTQSRVQPQRQSDGPPRGARRRAAPARHAPAVLQPPRAGPRVGRARPAGRRPPADGGKRAGAGAVPALAVPCSPMFMVTSVSQMAAFQVCSHLASVCLVDHVVHGNCPDVMTLGSQRRAVAYYSRGE